MQEADNMNLEEIMTDLVTTPIGLVVWRPSTKIRNAARAVKYSGQNQDLLNKSHTFDINQTIPIDSDFVRLISDKELALDQVVDHVYPTLKPRIHNVYDENGNRVRQEVDPNELMLNLNFKDPLPILDGAGNELEGDLRNIPKGAKISIEGRIYVDYWERDDQTFGKVRFKPLKIMVHERPEIKKSPPIKRTFR
jgi:hypothetical protein